MLPVLYLGIPAWYHGTSLHIPIPRHSDLVPKRYSAVVCLCLYLGSASVTVTGILDYYHGTSVPVPFLGILSC
jgi:hypothetical protein